MPYRSYLRGLLLAERFAERQADIDQDERVRLAVLESLARRDEREALHSVQPPIRRVK